MLRHDEQVFQIDPGAAQKGGEVVEEQGETYGDAVLFSQENFGLLLFKNPLSQEVACLNWNKPSIDFYLSLDATPMDQ